MTSPREVLQTFSALVLTGGSSGIGKSVIELGANLHPGLRVCNLSRRAPHMPDDKLMLCHVPCDLASAAEIERAAEEVEAFLNQDASAGRVLLINNSGFGSYGCFPEPNRTQQLQMLDVNIRAMVDLTARLLPSLKTRGGVVMNVASTAAFQPTPYLSVYGASKAFVLHWTLALNEEWRGTNLRAMAVCPGPTRTHFFQNAGLRPGSLAEAQGMSSEAVVLQSLRAIGRRRALVVPGWKNKILSCAGAFSPKVFAARIAGVIIKRQRLQQTPR